jgi:hypothetical protein
MPWSREFRRDLTPALILSDSVIHAKAGVQSAGKWLNRRFRSDLTPWPPLLKEEGEEKLFRLNCHPEPVEGSQYQ